MSHRRVVDKTANSGCFFWGPAIRLFGRFSGSMSKVFSIKSCPAGLTVVQ